MGKMHFAVIVNQKCIDQTLDANMNKVIFEGHIFLPHIQVFIRVVYRYRIKRASVLYIAFR